MGDFFKQEALGMPYWAWFTIALGVACLLIAIILISCLVKVKKHTDEADAETNENTDEEAREDVEPVKACDKQKEKRAPEPEESEPVKEPAKEKSEPKMASEPVKKDKKTAHAPEEKEPEESEKEDSTMEKKSETKVYHICKRKEDNKWQVKAEGADKALKLFLTQSEAIEYAKKVAGNQEGRIVIHKEGGGFRKLTY